MRIEYFDKAMDIYRTSSDNLFHLGIITLNVPMKNLCAVMPQCGFNSRGIAHHWTKAIDI